LGGGVDNVCSISHQCRTMVVTCPRCHRSLSSVSADGQPLFCMYCGQKLREAERGTADETRTQTQPYTPQPDEELSGESSSDVPPAPEPAPKEVGGYRLLKLLGAGGMGAVYEAEAPGSGARVAVKLLSSRLAANPSSVERFRQEGRLASQLAHPRCVFVLSADTDNGRPYIVMELMPGRTLKDLVDERGPLPPHEAVARVIDVIDGLTEAHRLGMIHRDVKPSNCFLTADDRVKVGDFGLSKSLAGRDQNLTQTGAFLGTVLYASPEQLRGEPLDYSSDVYSVAATLYFLLCGEAPFHHESATAALAKAISDPPPRLRKKRPDVSARLERVVIKGLERDRSRRWQTLDDLREALVDLLPERQRPARPRALVAAYVLDSIFAAVVVLTPLEMVLTAFDVPESNLTSWLFMIAYFALCEGLFGATAGKALLGLRVTRVGQTGPPGVPRAFVRALVFALIWAAIIVTLGVGIILLAVQLRRKWNYRGLHDFASGCQVKQQPWPARKLRLAVRQPTPLETVLPAGTDPLPESVGGYVVRGRLSAEPSGEQVWAAEDRALGRAVLLWLRPWGAADPGTDPARPARLRRLGRGSLGWGGSAFDWTAYAAPVGGPLAEAVRPGRALPWADARYLLEQLVEEFRAAEADGSLPARLALDHVWVEPNGRVQVLDFPLCEARYRPGAPLVVLREAASLALEGHPRRGSGPVCAPLPAHALPVLNRLFADDLPLAEFQKELAETHAHRPEVTPALRAAHLGMQAVALAAPLAVMFTISLMLAVGQTNRAKTRAEQAELAAAVLANPAERAKLSAGGNKALEAAVNNPRAPVRASDLAARTRADADRRRANLLLPQRLVLEQTERMRSPAPPRPAAEREDVREVILWAGASDKTPEGRSDSPSGDGAGPVLAALAAIPLGLVLLAAAWRGGLSMLMAGIAVVRADGRPAFRSQCAFRAALVWLPVGALLFLAGLIQISAPEWAYLAAGLWLVAAALLPVYAVVALRQPTRPPQDRIAGTYLVPV
jgi:hypothetical protein